MDYIKIYKQLIERAQLENRTKSSSIYFESHHIMPKCLGGTNEKFNLVLLTPKEHFIAHKLLCEIYPTTDKLQYALWAMMNLCNHQQIRDYSISSTEYERVRIKYQSLMKTPKTKEHRNKLSASWTDERRKNASIILSNRNKLRTSKNHPLYGKKRPEHSKLMKEKYSLVKKTISTEIREKISKTLTGRLLSNETKQKMKQTAQNRPMVTCTYCNLTAKFSPNMSRYHFDNCKQKGNA